MKDHGLGMHAVKFEVIVQEVPVFCDFWFQMVILKCEDHEFPGLFLV